MARACLGSDHRTLRAFAMVVAALVLVRECDGRRARETLQRLGHRAREGPASEGRQADRAGRRHEVALPRVGVVGPPARLRGRLRCRGDPAPPGLLAQVARRLSRDGFRRRRDLKKAWSSLPIWRKAWVVWTLWTYVGRFRGPITAAVGATRPGPLGPHASKGYLPMWPDDVRAISLHPPGTLVR